MSRTSFSYFLLVLSFGVLFVGCSSKQAQTPFEEFSFSETDLARVQELSSLASKTDASTGAVIETTLGGDSGTSSGRTLTPSLSASGATLSAQATTSEITPATVLVNPEKRSLYNALRESVAPSSADANLYRVNNAFLNIRASMDIRSNLLKKLNRGDVLTVLHIPSAEWAEVQLRDGTKGFAAFRYLAKVTTEDRLSEEKKLFEGKYFVDYAFLNIRKDPSTQAVKVGELPGQAIVKPLSLSGDWARVAYNGAEGYVSTQYLKPFLPTFLVRQDAYALPIVVIAAEDKDAVQALPEVMKKLKAAGKRITTLRTLYDTVLAEESRDARIAPGTVALAMTGVNAKNVRAVQDALESSGVPATLFIQTKDVGLTGITEKTVLTLLANGYDLQSGGHTGDDLRSLTDSQVALELQQSKKILEDITKREVYAVGYPKGGVNDRVMETAADSAYLFGLSIVPDVRFTRSQFLRLPGNLFQGSMTSDDVLHMLSK